VLPAALGAHGSLRRSTEVPLGGGDGLLKGLLKAALERGREVELTDHVGHERGDPDAADERTAVGHDGDEALAPVEHVLQLGAEG
jgi:hypothetical protein